MPPYKKRGKKRTAASKVQEDVGLERDNSSDLDLDQGEQPVTQSEGQGSTPAGASANLAADDTEGGEGGPKMKRAKREKTLLAEEDEDDLIEWVKANPCLYNKGLRDYRDAQKRNQLWADKAAELNMTVDALACWWKSIRTRYGKISGSKSGDGAREMTDRDKYILDRLSFLQHHICRIVGRQTSALKPGGVIDLDPSACSSATASTSTATTAAAASATTAAAASASTATAATASTATADTEDVDVEALQTPTRGLRSSRTPTPIPPKRARRTGSVESRDGDDVMIQMMREGNEDTRKVMQKIDDAIVQCMAQPNSRRAWGHWMTARMEGIDDSLWDEFQDECYNLIKVFVGRTTRVRERREERAREARQAEALQQQQLLQQQQQPQLLQQPPQLLQQQPQLLQQQPQLLQQQPQQYVIQYVTAPTTEEQQQQQQASTSTVTTAANQGPMTTPRPQSSSENISLSDLGNLSFGMPALSSSALSANIMTPTALLDASGSGNTET